MKNREDYSDLTEQELEEKYRHYKEELFNLRFQVVTGQLANPSRIGIVRRNIARVKTYITQMEKTRCHSMLQEEYKALLADEKIDPQKTPLKQKIAMLKANLNKKARKVQQEIRSEVDAKITELLKSLRSQISQRLRTVKGKEEAQLRASSKRLRDAKYVVRKKFLDKLSAMGLNEASQIASLRETKRTKLSELERIRALQRELTTGRLPF